MENNIHDSLTLQLICLSSSPLGAGFFVEKKDKTLQPYIYYRGLNDIMVKKKTKTLPSSPY